MKCQLLILLSCNILADLIFLCHFHPSQSIHDPFHFLFIWTCHLIFCIDLKMYVISDFSCHQFLITVYLSLTAHSRMRSLECNSHLGITHMQTDRVRQAQCTGFLASFLALVFVMGWRWSRQDLSEQKSSPSTMLRYGQKQQLNGVSSMCAKDKQTGKTN